MSDWQPEHFSSGRDVVQLAERMRSEFDVEIMDHDIEWMNAVRDPDKDDIFVLTRRDGDRLTGAAVFACGPAHLDYEIGGLRFVRKMVRQFELRQGLLTPHDGKSPDLDVFFSSCAKQLPHDSVLLLRDIPVDSSLYKALTSPDKPLGRYFHILPWGGIQPHFKITWDGSFDSYLSRLNSSRRSNLKRAEKRFFTQNGFEAQLKRFAGEEELDDFMKEAVPVSEKTYQTRLLGLGVVKGGEVERRLREAAKRGYFRGHVLYVNGKAVAFQYAFVYGTTIFLTETGYDPEWARHEIGTIIFAALLRDIEEHERGIHILDFLSGANVFKARTSNVSVDEQDFFLFHKNVAGGFYYRSLRALNGITESVGDLLDRFQVKSKIKKFVQKKTGRGHI